MHYSKVVEGVFLERPNRFIAIIQLTDGVVRAHVKNTGRCRELLIPGVKVYLEDHGINNARKTRFSLISVWKDKMLINIDSQIPNAVVSEALAAGLIPEIATSPFIKREASYGASRFDLYYEESDKKGFVEVKGVTLEMDGIAKFPDAPTIRGTKHLRELVAAKAEGFEASILFLVQMRGPLSFMPNKVMDPIFAEAYEEALLNGVDILVYDSIVTSDSISIGSRLIF